MNNELFEAFSEIVIGEAEGLLDDEGVDEEQAAGVAKALVAEVERVNAAVRADEDLIAAARGVIDAWESGNLAEAVNSLRESLEQAGGTMDRASV